MLDPNFAGLQHSFIDEWCGTCSVTRRITIPKGSIDDTGDNLEDEVDETENRKARGYCVRSSSPPRGTEGARKYETSKLSMILSLRFP